MPVKPYSNEKPNNIIAEVVAPNMKYFMPASADFLSPVIKPVRTTKV